MKLINEYRSKKIAAEQIAQIIKPGMRVYMEQGPAEPDTLVQAMIDHAEQMAGISIIATPVPNLNKAPFVDNRFNNIWKVFTFMGSAQLYKAIAEGSVDYVPAHATEIPTILQSTLKVDVAVVQVSPMNASGFCNLGVAVETIRAAIDAADIVIAQVNRKLPISGGDTSVHISEIDYLIEADAELLEFPSTTPGDGEYAIAGHVLPLIPDGATLQIGIGSVPDAILGTLVNKNDLGLHSGMISEKVVELMKLGVMNGKQKKINRGKLVGAMLLGSQNLYDFADHNPQIELHSSTYINDIRLAKELDHFISINSAVEMDLTGQVNSEAVSNKLIGGIGGAQDFMRIARFSRGGKSIIAMNAATRGKSKIVPQLSSSNVVSAARIDVDMVVTEYGVAELKHQSIKERAHRMAAIAHPDFRAELMAWIDTNL